MTATTASLTGNWDFSQRWAFNAMVSDQRQEYLNSSRTDDLLTLMGGVTFKIRPGLGLNVNYIHQNLFSNVPGAEYTRDFISVGANTKF